MESEKRRQPLSRDQKDHLFGCLLRLPAIFVRAKDLLKIEDISEPADVPYLLLWHAAKIVAEHNNGQLPALPEQTRVQLEIEAKGLAEGDPQTVSAGDVEALFGPPGAPHEGLISFIFDQPATIFAENEGTRLLKSYLEELTLYSEVQAAAKRWQHGLPDSLTPFLDKIQRKKAQIASLDESAVLDAVPDEDECALPDTFTTGVSFLDNFMGGGQLPGEVYVILAATGQGKTTLGVQIVVEGALYQLQQFGPNNGGHWFYITYESAVKSDIRIRVAAYAAQVSENSIRTKNFSSEKLANWKSYEQQLWSETFQKYGTMKGEQERYEAFKTQLRGANLHLCDYMGTYPGVGTGGVDEIVAMLENYAARGVKITGVVIDYATEGIRRYLMAHNLDPKHEYSHTAGYIDAVRTKIGARFNCSTWVLQQLHGDCAKKPPGTLFHHSEALGCRNFADNSWFAFCISNQDRENNTTLINCTKTRRSPPKSPAVVRFEGEIRRLTAADNQYALDIEQRRTVPKIFTGRIVSSKPKRAGYYNDPASDLN